MGDQIGSPEEEGVEYQITSYGILKKRNSCAIAGHQAPKGLSIETGSQPYPEIGYEVKNYRTSEGATCYLKRALAFAQQKAQKAD